MAQCSVGRVFLDSLLLAIPLTSTLLLFPAEAASNSCVSFPMIDSTKSALNQEGRDHPSDY